MAEQTALESPKSISENRQVPLYELALFFLRLGTTAFGGPAATSRSWRMSSSAGDSGFLGKNSSTYSAQAISFLDRVRAKWLFILAICAPVGEVC